MRSQRASVTASSVTVTDLSCRYGRLTAVDRVSLHVGAGEHVAVMGANGSGKSTLLRAVAGLQTPVSGSIAIDDEVVSTRPARARERTAWVPQRQSPGRFPLLVRELLASSGDPDAAHRAAARLGVGALARRPVSTLSGGQMQRAFLARAIGAVDAGASVLLADEPTAALDFEGQEEIARLLRELPVTVVVVTHDRAVADTCDRRVEMAAGRLREVE